MKIGSMEFIILDNPTWCVTLPAEGDVVYLRAESQEDALNKLREGYPDRVPNIEGVTCRLTAMNPVLDSL